jgi:hypothetical protein
MHVRRGPAMANLTSVGINLLALAVLVTAFEAVGPAVCLPFFAGLGLVLLYLRLYTVAAEKCEDLFPQVVPERTTAASSRTLARSQPVTKSAPRPG